MRSFARLALVITLTGSALAQPPLWKVYEKFFKRARYVDLTHTIQPDSTVWKGFGPQQFDPAIEPESGRPYSYAKDGFEATRYTFSTDQLGTQLDPPAHWNPDYPSIDELPATYSLRPLVVISIVNQVGKDPGYSLTIPDIQAWEKIHGQIPAGSVVFVRSDWSKRWRQPGLAGEAVFPGVGLAALQFLHLKRHILFHGHEPLDTDCTPDLLGEAWLLKNGYAQAEGVANLDRVPESGALVAMGFPKLRGGTGGYARYIAICPPDWKYGLKVGQQAESPLPKQSKPLHWDSQKKCRVR
ncbi:cyclase family protein [bacterium]|nr:cyclase family protein [bacterium]